MILDDIIEKTKYDLEKRKKDITLDTLGRSLSHNPYPPRDVRKFLTATKEEPIRIIAEVKKVCVCSISGETLANSISDGSVFINNDPTETIIANEAAIESGFHQLILVAFTCLFAFNFSMNRI